ncbi:MAG TPA: hypothetical protein VHJ78_00785 [Actinomycetota bacterium]|nr:hypothetical protein [Actinomycetota bacterium]
MSHRKRIAATAAVGVVMSLGGVAHAAPPGTEFRPAPNAGSNANCVGLASAGATHNGQFVTLGQGGDPSHGARGDEIKAFQAAC